MQCQCLCPPTSPSLFWDVVASLHRSQQHRGSNQAVCALRPHYSPMRSGHWYQKSWCVWGHHEMKEHASYRCQKALMTGLACRQPVILLGRHYILTHSQPWHLHVSTGAEAMAWSYGFRSAQIKIHPLPLPQSKDPAKQVVVVCSTTQPRILQIEC